MSRFWPLIKLLPIKTNFRFVRYAKLFGSLSVLLVVASVFFTIWPADNKCGGLTCGVDFLGGNLIEMSTAPEPVDLAEIRASLNDQGVPDAQVQSYSVPGSDPSGRFHAMAKFGNLEGVTAGETINRVKAGLTEDLGAVQFTRTEAVGAAVSGELLQNGVMALLVAIVLMLVYIWFRFEWQFGLGAVIGLFHDVILTFGLFALTGMEFSLTAVASILTVIGYSMNDTVVVYDRIRENLRKYKKMPLGELIDLSINETLSRTIMTGVTALFALGVLAVLGGGPLQPFAIALIFGIVVGTYSSVYVAAPVLLLWGVKRGGPDDVKPVKLGMASQP
ncbi:protein translocase subunit SecF [Brevundimonas viscosa]|uniref:Protein-export membrane protein SecF n=1 Tax=Brevundimonas viscosa TaxID=871741 RepID=A0A1I6PXR8_9CAUL|nr:protein translocase subunit SecF [Brevundimonas viscosa]SFS44898.1 protein translocase subunit secF [Brevundimonas viscosa]